MPTEPIILVTGANSGVGFGICHRLLVQLSSARPSDSRPVFDIHGVDHASREAHEQYSFSPQVGVTIILACRDLGRAQQARRKLYELLDEHLLTLAPGSLEHEQASTFRGNVKLHLEALDLASMESVLRCGRALSQKYPYLSHLILNAGTATYSHLDITRFTLDLIRHPIWAIHHPRANIQVNGVLSKDNLGYTWQCNVFGHYALYRSLLPLLIAYTRLSGVSSRVLWMSSLDAEPRFDPEDDWQLTKTFHSYEASKYQVDLVCSELERRTAGLQEGTDTSPSLEVAAPHGEVHHVLVSPGLTITNMSALLNIKIPGWRWQSKLTMWLVRLLGGRHILTSVYAAAIAPVHAALAPLNAIPTSGNSPQILPTDTDYPPWHSYCELRETRVQALRLGSESDRWGNERSGVIAVPVWEQHPEAVQELLRKFERLYQMFTRADVDGARGEDILTSSET